MTFFYASLPVLYSLVFLSLHAIDEAYKTSGPWAACVSSEFLFFLLPLKLFKTPVEYSSKIIVYKKNGSIE